MVNLRGWFCYYVFKLKTGMLFVRHNHWDFMEAYCAIINFVFVCSFFTSLSENVVSLDIYFNDLQYDEIEQIPSFELWSLFGKCCIRNPKVLKSC